MTTDQIEAKCDRLIEIGADEPLSWVDLETGISCARALKIALDYIEQMKEADRIATEELCTRGFDARDDGIRAQAKHDTALAAIRKEFEP